MIFQEDMDRGTDSHSPRLVRLCVQSPDPEEARWSLRDGGDGVDAPAFVLPYIACFLRAIERTEWMKQV